MVIIMLVIYVIIYMIVINGNSCNIGYPSNYIHLIMNLFISTITGLAAFKLSHLIKHKFKLFEAQTKRAESLESAQRQLHIEIYNQQRDHYDRTVLTAPLVLCGLFGIQIYIYIILNVELKDDIITVVYFISYIIYAIYTTTALGRAYANTQWNKWMPRLVYKLYDNSCCDLVSDKFVKWSTSSFTTALNKGQDITNYSTIDKTSMTLGDEKSNNQKQNKTIEELEINQDNIEKEDDVILPKEALTILQGDDKDTQNDNPLYED